MKSLALVSCVLLTAACGGASTPASPAGGSAQDGHRGHDHGSEDMAADRTPQEGEAGASAGEPPGEAPPDPEQVKAALLEMEATAYVNARPIFERHCAACHKKGGKKAKAKTLGHFDMSSYPFGGHHTDEISAEIRKVLAIGGGKPTMPLDKPGAVQGDELRLIAAWADAYDRAHEGGAHGERGHGTDHHHHGGGHKH